MSRNRNRVACWIVTLGAVVEKERTSLPLACPELSADFIRLPPGKTRF